MIDISFLNKPTPLKLRSGMEYLEWQNKDFFNELSQFFKNAHPEEKEPFVLDAESALRLSSLIMQRTRMNVIIDANRDHFAIRNGYISPGNLLNRKGIEQRLNADDSVVGTTFRWLNTEALTGRCNLKTGQVEGDFQKVVFLMAFGRVDAAGLTSTPTASRYDQLAAMVLHELGHAFFSLYYISQTVIDNLLLAQVVKYYTKEPDTNKRVSVARQLKTETDIALPENIIRDTIDPNVIAIGFEEGLKQRNTRRTLSLGVEKITGETLADIYAVRMGASLALVDGLSSVMTKKSYLGLSLTLSAVLGGFALFLTSFAGFALLLTGVTFGFTLLSALISPWRGLVSGQLYDTPYRRLKAILRENIAYINSLSSTDGYSSAEKARLIADAKQIDAIVEKQKPFFESTVMQRIVGLLTQGRDAKKTDFEYFTAELAAPTLSLYTLLP